ncbi:peptidylprolyl isomerase [Colwellia piezophila]|uniref:peptidylprolyl isomerase n=1 Tax=Colwellia piezophila TaxID=211668 RepID=UPI0003802BAA|nr:peptidylprolyl isomerase [Colwellia piezophila]
MLKKTTKIPTKKLLAIAGLITASFGLTNTANATIVEFQTSQGNIQVNLFDSTTPETVKNFLSYVNAEHYTDTVVHRVAPGFVVQAGGYAFDGVWPLTALESNEPVINEPVYSNVKGTIAMAKKGGDVNSATNQWFFNLQDNNDPLNTKNLDIQNGGFTVFGQVIEGMDIVEKIGLLKLCSTSQLQDIPMVMDEDQGCLDMDVAGIENFVAIKQIVIVDSSEVTDGHLTPLINTLIDEEPAPAPTPDPAPLPTPKDSGGSLTWFALAMLALAATRRRLF